MAAPPVILVLYINVRTEANRELLVSIVERLMPMLATVQHNVLLVNDQSGLLKNFEGPLKYS